MDEEAHGRGRLLDEGPGDADALEEGSPEQSSVEHGLV